MREQFLALMPLSTKAMLVSTNCFQAGEVIKDNVDIGACTIDKGVTGDTTIGEGTKSIIRCM
jgi:UDP-3-O-[3-hydroxymyristoyl] glucosamine N-acyltransferase